MNVLICVNSFKGTASSKEINKILSKVLVRKGYDVVVKNVSDGGDGFLDCFSETGNIIKKKVTGPFYGSKISASYVIDKKDAFIEIARVCGIRYLEEKQLDIMNATTYGVGELIKDAINRGAIKIYLGLGGTASNDAGFGMAKALGVRFLDGKGDEVENSIFGLIRVKKIDFSNFISIDGIDFYGVCDVKNKLLGKYGSAKIFGPQKGALPKDIPIIEKALTNFKDVLLKQKGIDISKITGGASAGGLGAGISGILGGRLLNGSDFVMKKLNLISFIKKADIIITGEGKLDKSSFYGKITGEIIKISLKYHKKIFVFCGLNEYEKAIRGANLISFDKKYPVPFLKKNILSVLKKEINNIL
ncbi:MAG: glycerate kinase [Elusimicrobiota bacterium]